MQLSFLSSHYVHICTGVGVHNNNNNNNYNPSLHLFLTQRDIKTEKMDVAREGYISFTTTAQLRDSALLLSFLYTNLPSLHPFSFHEMIFILVY